MNEQTQKSFQDSIDQQALKMSEIVAKRTAVLTTRKFLWLSLVPPFIFTRVWRMRRLRRIAREFVGR